MSKRTPTTDEVRNGFAFIPYGTVLMRFSDDEAAKFDRWREHEDAHGAALERNAVIQWLEHEALAFNSYAQGLALSNQDRALRASGKAAAFARAALAIREGRHNDLEGR